MQIEVSEIERGEKAKGKNGNRRDNNSYHKQNPRDSDSLFFQSRHSVG